MNTPIIVAIIAAIQVSRGRLLAVCSAWVLGMAVLSMSFTALAEADLDVNTPAMQALKSRMKQRHLQLLNLYQTGAVGLTNDGYIAVREASVIPLSQRAALAALVKDENNDRSALYSGIASANGHPEWTGEIQRIFAQRWLERAQPGWYLQKDEQWFKK